MVGWMDGEGLANQSYGMRGWAMEGTEDVFGDVAPCSLVEVYRRFRGACYLHHHGDYGGSKHL
jgi:hypothetical protein